MKEPEPRSLVSPAGAPHVGSWVSPASIVPLLLASVNAIQPVVQSVRVVAFAVTHAAPSVEAHTETGTLRRRDSLRAIESVVTRSFALDVTRLLRAISR